jgi:hypothetical protein
MHAHIVLCWCHHHHHKESCWCHHHHHKESCWCHHHHHRETCWCHASSQRVMLVPSSSQRVMLVPSSSQRVMLVPSSSQRVMLVPSSSSSSQRVMLVPSSPHKESSGEHQAASDSIAHGVPPHGPCSDNDREYSTSGCTGGGGGEWAVRRAARVHLVAAHAGLVVAAARVDPRDLLRREPPSERGVRLARKVQVGPCILVGTQLEVGPTSKPTWRLSHYRSDCTSPHQPSARASWAAAEAGHLVFTRAAEGAPGPRYPGASRRSARRCSRPSRSSPARTRTCCSAS